MDVVKSNFETKDEDLRILIFTATYFVLDGVTLTIRRLESHMRSRGATVKICTTVGSDLDAEQTKDVIIVPGIKIPFSQAGNGYAIGVGLDENTIRQIEEYGPNCVHFTVPDFVALDGLKWCQNNNVPYIGTWHSNYTDYLKYYYIEWAFGPTFHRYLKGFFQQIPVIYVPTPYMLGRLKEWNYDTATELREWGRGIDLKLFSPERRSKEFRLSKGIAETDIVVLWVGRLVPEKRVDIWINTIKRLQTEGLSVHAMVVGNGTFEKALASISRVSFCGWLSGTALAEAYASSDILLFPSDVETFGNVTLEALASGCPCVVERKCGEHLVDHNSNGVCCEAGDADDFYQATRRLVLDAELRRSMGVEARKSSWRFERNTILQQMLENYKDAIYRHSDPLYIKNRLASSDEAAGKNLLSFMCCNYWLLKTILEPSLSTAQGVQNLVIGTNDCINSTRNRCPCTAELHNRLEEGLGRQNITIDSEAEKKGRPPQRLQSRYVSLCMGFLSKCIHYSSVSFSVGMLMVFIYAAFTV